MRFSLYISLMQGIFCGEDLATAGSSAILFRIIPCTIFQNGGFALSSHDEHGAFRVLHHSRRHAPNEKPGDRAKPFGPHHDQIGLL